MGLYAAGKDLAERKTTCSDKRERTVGAVALSRQK